MDAEERERAVLEADEAHAAETDVGGAVVVVRVHDLIGGQRNTAAVREDDERTWRTVLQDREPTDDERLADHARSRNEVHEDGDAHPARYRNSDGSQLSPMTVLPAFRR